MPEIIKHGESGILVEPMNPEQLAEAITRLLSDKQKMLSIGSNAREVIMERFDLKNNINKLEDIYLRLSQCPN